MSDKTGKFWKTRDTINLDKTERLSRAMYLDSNGNLSKTDNGGTLVAKYFNEEGDLYYSNYSLVYKTIGYWSPSAIDTVAWYDAADPSTITATGGSVSQWDDKSGNGADLVQGTASLQPTTNSRTIGGLNVIEFVSDRLFCGTNILTPADGIMTICCVAKVDSSSDLAGLYCLENATGSSFVGTIGYASGTDFNAVTLYSPDYVLGPTGVAHNGPSIYGTMFDGVFSNFVDGSLKAEESSTSWVPAALTTLDVGYQAGFSSGYLDCIIGELVIAVGGSDVIRQKMEGYLAWKWGLVSNLPVNHIYKNRQPLL